MRCPSCQRKEEVISQEFLKCWTDVENYTYDIERKLESKKAYTAVLTQLVENFKKK